MINVKFLGAQEVEDGEGIVIQRFRAGQVIELTNASARFWLSRGLALDVQDAARDTRLAAEDAAEKKPEAEKPEAVESGTADAKPEAAATVNPTSPKRGRGRPRSA